MATNNSGVTVPKVLATLALALLAGGVVNVAIVMVDRALDLESAVWGVLDTALSFAAMGSVFWWLHKRWLRNTKSNVRCEQTEVLDPAPP